MEGVRQPLGFAAVALNVTKLRSDNIDPRDYSAYAIRKLFEAQKLTSSLDGQSLRCSRIERTESHITRLDVYDLDQHYDLSKSSPETVNLRKGLVNEIIHSFIFALNCDSNDVADGFYVASDRNYHERMLLVPMKEYIEAMRKIGRNKVVRIDSTRLPNRDWRTTRW